jgi:uncharacterized protein (TIGR01777 family)
MKPKVILAGGSGFVGQSLAPLLLSRGYEVVVLTRAPPSIKRDGVLSVHWDGKNLGDWARVLDGATALVNLTGRSINCRHTPENRRQIVESRVDSVHVLGAALARAKQPPPVFVQAAGIGIYGDAGDRWCDESAPHGDDFVTEVCEKWEGAFDQVNAPQTRKVLLRLGVALGAEGGFLQVLAKLTRCFLGGQIGNGRQFVSWIHMADLCRIFLTSIERPEIEGLYNATSPNPVTNAEFMRELRRTLHRPWSPPVPKFAARLGAWLMGTAPSLAFASQRGIPKHLLAQDFRFDFPELRLALTNLLSKP